MKGEGIAGCIASRRAALKIWCGAVLLLGALGHTHAGLFDDDEARKQIAVERRRIDELKNELKNELKQQQEAFEARFAKVEEALKNQALLDLFTQLEALRLDVNRLRGQIEVLNNNIENTAKRQRDMYVDLDSRLRRFEQQAGAAPAAPAVAPAIAAAAAQPAVPPTQPAASVAQPAAPAAKPAAPAAASAPAASPARPATGAPSVTPAPAAVVTSVDPGIENRAYEAAHGLRRGGNYQGAIVAFQNFLNQHPKSNLAPRAQYWIGDSYFNLRDFKLAIANQQTLIKAYPDSPSVPDAMLNMASSQIEMGESNAGRKTLEELAAKHPASEAADKARRRLATLLAPGKP